MQELQLIADRIAKSKIDMLKAEKLISVAKRAGEDVSSLELRFRENQKKLLRWEQALLDEGYTI